MRAALATRHGWRALAVVQAAWDRRACRTAHSEVACADSAPWPQGSAAPQRTHSAPAAPLSRLLACLNARQCRLFGLHWLKDWLT
jgi:hypothetical protein